MSLERLPGVTAVYNGHSFGPSAETTNFSLKPMRDPADRTVTDVMYKITIKDTITSGGAEGDELDTALLVRTAIENLSKDAGQFEYSGRGFGDLKININNVRDVKWGPKVTELSCVPTGAGLAVELTWSVEFRVPNCYDAQYKGVLYFNFSVAFDIDADGYTTRKYDAELAIAMTRKSVGDRSIPENVDAYREHTVPPLQTGFRRDSQIFSVSQDKTVLKTSIVDSEMPPEVPPDGCVRASFDNTWQTSGSFAKWSVTFDGVYDIARQAGTARQAVQDFIRVVKNRGDATVRRIKIGDGIAAGGGAVAVGAVEAIGGGRRIFGGKVPYIPWSARASEPNVYGRQQVKLSVTFLTAGFGLGAVVESSGLWERISLGAPDKQWLAWRSSLPTTFSPRGNAMLAFREGDDKIVDLCKATRPTPPVMSGPNYSNLIGGSITTGLLDIALRKAFPPPPPESSWIGMVMDMTVRAATGRILGSTLPSSPITLDHQPTSQTWDAMGDIPAAGYVPSPFPPLAEQLRTGSLSDRTGTFVQQRVKPTLYVTISGAAVRAGHSVPVPELVRINGKTPVLVGTPYFKQAVVYESLSAPIVRAEWNLTFAITDGGTQTMANLPIPVPPNGLLA